MENKNYITVFITTFYVLGLCAFYTEKRLFFAVTVCLLLILLCYFNKLKPVLCLVLCFIFFGGFLNADFQNKKIDTFSSIQSADNTILKGRVYSIPAINKEKNIAKFYMGVYEANIQSENFKPENTKVLVSIFDTKESYNNIKIGDVIKIKGNLRTPREATNPSEFDYKKYLQNKDVFVILYSNNKNFTLLLNKELFIMNKKDKFIFDKDLVKDRIRELRKLRNLTQEQASELIGMKDSNSWAKLESHKGTLALSFDNLIRIVNLFDIDVNYIFRNNETEEQERERHTETLVVSMMKDLSEKDKQLILSMISLFRQNRDI